MKRRKTTEEWEHEFELSLLRGRLGKLKKGQELQAGFITDKIAHHERELNRLGRRYHVVSIRERDNEKTYMTAEPVTHNEGCTIMRKTTVHKHRRIQLEEA